MENDLRRESFDYSEQILALIRSDVSDDEKKSQLGEYHENDIAFFV